jgi:hypothetical protein
MIMNYIPLIFAAAALLAVFAFAAEVSSADRENAAPLTAL